MENWGCWGAALGAGAGNMENVIAIMKDEEDAFFCLIHVLKIHDWRGCFAEETPKLISFLDFLDVVLESAYDNIYHHIMEEIEIRILKIPI